MVEESKKDVRIEVPGAEIRFETYRAGIKTRFRDPNNANFEIEEVDGHDWSESLGRWVKKQRVIDRKNNRYYELVIDEETGDVLRECEQPLKEHTGRGSAKNRSDEKG